MLYDITVDGKNYRLELRQAEGRWQCRLDGHDVEVDAMLVRQDVLSILIDGKSYEVKRERNAGELYIWVGGERHATELRDPRSLRGRRDSGEDDQGPRKLIAPMAGKIVRVLMQENAEVEAGQGVLVVEAMKMQNEIKSPKKGIVRKIVASEGTAVNAGDVL